MQPAQSKTLTELKAVQGVLNERVRHHELCELQLKRGESAFLTVCRFLNFRFFHTEGLEVCFGCY